MISSSVLSRHRRQRNGHGFCRELGFFVGAMLGTLYRHLFQTSISNQYLLHRGCCIQQQGGCLLEAPQIDQIRSRYVACVQRRQLTCIGGCSPYRQYPCPVILQPGSGQHYLHVCQIDLAPLGGGQPHQLIGSRVVLEHGNNHLPCLVHAVQATQLDILNIDPSTFRILQDVLDFRVPHIAGNQPGFR